jgi:glycosyltransferase involved in cell wall biosynthesis
MSGPKVVRRKKNGWDIAPQMTAYTAKDAGEVVGTIAICTRGRVSAGTAISWLMTDYGFLNAGETVSRYFIEGNMLAQQRNECVQRMQGDWLMFIDDDMIFPPSAIRTLVETQRKFDSTIDMLGGLCFQRGAPYQPTMYVRDPESGQYQFREVWDDDAAVEVDASGMAFMLIHKRVFDRILRHRTGESFPTYEERLGMPPPPFFTWGGEFGEDFKFCQDAKAAGCRIFVDTSVEIGHLGEHIITKETFLRELAFRPRDVVEERRARYAHLGLEAMEPAEARRRLGVGDEPRRLQPVRPTLHPKGGDVSRLPQ